VSTTTAALPATYSRAWGYVSLTKPDVTFLVLITTSAGYYMGSAGPLNWLGMVHAVLGTALIGAGTSALNHYLERDQDAVMRRTAQRPLPAAVLLPRQALLFGASLAVAGAAYLAVAVNWLACLLGVFTSVSYLCCYTPLKKRTWLSTLVGAFPGAVPPLIGWAAARGSLSVEALLLYAVLFVWQFPHFYAIAWMYREDYARAGIQMLPVVDRSGDRTYRQILVFSAVLVPVSLLPAVTGLSGKQYFFGALVLSVGMMLVSFWAARMRSNQRAKWLMHATVLYVPVLLGLMAAEKALR
jgi:protoheme IX farnesyltransferase